MIAWDAPCRWEPTVGNRVAIEAERWIDTPFRFQQSCRGAGCDCKGLISGIVRDLGLPEAQSPYALIADYTRVDPELLRRGLTETMDPATEPRRGDLLLIRLGGKAQHLAIYVGDNRMIHTMPRGPERVRKVPMGKSTWNKVDSIWRWRE